MEPLSAGRLVGLLAGPERRRVVAAMILGATSRDDIAAQAGLDTRAVVDALDRLVGAGLVEDGEDGTYLLLAQAFERAARAEAPAPEPTAFPDEVDDRRRILDRAFADGRLARMPAKRSHRLIVLDQLVQRFEPGRRYTEKQVNAVLAAVDPDTAALRRYLVDEAMLDRADGEYWRIGG
ncbi:MAG: DUF2087 domain-containing protein [Actinomycetota bacterium]